MSGFTNSANSAATTADTTADTTAADPSTTTSTAARNTAPSPALEHTRELGHCLVTGAAGFLGRNLVKQLLSSGCKVTALINRTPLDLQHENLRQVTGNVCEPEQMMEACKGIDTVFHTAASIALMGGRFAHKSYRQQAWDINVGGTRNVVEACQIQSVQRLIYTSSVDVCFDGEAAPAMHEGMPYAESPKSVYAETKIAAEKLVLAANNTASLFTCAIRPDGIYGAEPNEMIDAFCAQVLSGSLKARIGHPTTLQDNSHVSNLVHGEILAARNLVPGGVACGQAYFIGDDNPLNTFDFFKPLIEGLGARFPKRSVPAGLLKPVAGVWQSLHFLIKLPEPLLVPHVLDKVSVTHYASVEKARKELRYEPVITVAEAMEACLVYCKTKL
jgi:3beta-hydroxy-delta5-steroid dehydrogenase/steroid delta-isomerase